MVWKRDTKFANVGLVKGRTFANPAVHPHRNDMGVPPPPGLSTHIKHDYLMKR